MKVMTKKKFSVIGIGYVGLPLAVALSRNNKIVGFDTNINRVKGLQKGNDITKEFKKNDFIKNKNLIFTNKEAEIKNSDVFFITVPTPINDKNKPNLDHLEQASKTVARNIKRIRIYTAG